MIATAPRTEHRTDAASEPRRRRRLGRWLLAGVAVLLLLVVGRIGWFYADEILVVPESTPPVGDVGVLSVDPSEALVVLARTPASAEPGVWGLQGPQWYARIGRIVAEDAAAGTVTRTFEPLPDAPVAGELALVDGYAHPEDPQNAFPFDVDPVAIPGPLGDYPALHVPGESSTWAIFVHGRGARLGEAFRMLPATVERGLPSLVVSYRNDVDAPADPHNRYGLGWTEAQDVAAAIDWAVERGADDVVLIGFSMGGAIVSNVERLHDGVPIRGMVLDAPVVDWGETLRHAAQDRGVPTALTPIAQAVVTLRTGLRWGALSLLERAEDLDVPILLIHGDADDTVPIEGSDALAAARPDLVTYLRVPGAGHVQSWNADPEAYRAAVDDFLSHLGL